MATFDLAIPTVLKNEGGYIFDPNDPGGETNYGISKRAYPDIDIKNLTVEKAKEIYQRDFWKFSGLINQDVATKIFDSYVNMKHTAIRIAQSACGLDVADQDGNYGPRTEKAINQMSAPYFLGSYRSELSQYYTKLATDHPTLEKFLVGWLRRAKG